MSSLLQFNGQVSNRGVHLEFYQTTESTKALFPLAVLAWLVCDWQASARFKPFPVYVKDEIRAIAAEPMNPREW